LKKTRIHSEIVPEQEDPQVEAKKKNKSKEMDKKMKTMIREIGEDAARIREENKAVRKQLAAMKEEKEELRKELAAMSEG
jgi:DNA-directed RNA polymerase beta' subunit